MTDLNSAAPAGYGYLVTPSDTGKIKHTRALYVGGAGNVTVQMFDPNLNTYAAVTFTAVPAGSILPIKTNQVMATGTTATAIVGLA